MSSTIAEYARRHTISEQRARQLAREGKLRARREGRSWVIEDDRQSAPTRRSLSHQSQDDLITFLNTKSFRHVTGFRRTRLIERVRALVATDAPAELLREYFGDRQPEGRGGAAIVRAAQIGLDGQVSRVLRFIEPATLSNREAVAQKLKDIRAIKGISADELARRAKVDVRIVRRLESAADLQATNANLRAALLFRALDYTPATIHTERGRGGLNGA